MPTQRMKPGNAWHRLTDGTKSITLQVMDGIVYLYDSPAVPPGDAEGHVLPPGIYTVSPPFSAWVKSGTDSTITWS